MTLGGVAEAWGATPTVFDPGAGGVGRRTGTRRFPLPESIAEAMRVRAGSEATSAFPGFGEPKDQSLRSRLARACRRAKVRAFTPRQPRRTVVDRVLRSGVDLATAASLTGTRWW